MDGAGVDLLAELQDHLIHLSLQRAARLEQSRRVFLFPVMPTHTKALHEALIRLAKGAITAWETWLQKQS